MKIFYVLQRFPEFYILVKTLIVFLEAFLNYKTSVVLGEVFFPLKNMENLLIKVSRNLNL